ncbi:MULTISPECIES: HAD-IA family hydrolase [unclassified Mucilaginibacter]|uniref:HAD-IA family hydrolase n=1 Tax=unclassified Mucilaginibacter TaxID=2617802 RepID=UPI002AC9A8A3|nr:MULTISPECIES: HAD-IA family hydrolase [unclassified Mucilaginibacter]MEB0263211.1 HAD-IA family hydrolase [Mucilaginibacter sp. 10I4]MEB0278681.1 HAD-IA family hydrolase [Mucilaginibacter sp. 10B2]MEB0299391.1 HAD-IA family hydrolase [Mucilaginibacter sp. 5C4]WPX23367.1 HAD-IA family hydrolase [Mucilaginibacter sp. 5C4]
MPIKLVVFDMAGTTVRDENKVADTFSAAMQKYGYSVTVADVNPLMGYEKSVAITKMLQQHELDTSKITPKLIHNIHQEFINLMISYYRTTPVLEALPHAEATLAALKYSGVKIGINTGFSKDIAETIIQRLQWCEKGLIDYLIGSDEVVEGRPNPAMINRMMALAGVTNAQEVAKIGDTEVDIREGQNAGCKYVIAVTTGAFTRAELEPYNPTHIIDDIADVISIIS